ncbi:MAG TPA: sigma-70 family RNA polymerase sigma factor [Acidiferrobacteraceae bacterium]|nr:sigma-70 family RNA polymerase sigma factor [Acidiferrobacteraceae bacterium]
MTPSETPDLLVPLLVRMQAGDTRALQQLYERTAGKLFSVALRIVRRRSLAEEVLQDAYIKIWHHCGHYSTDKGTPLTWMAAIVRNRAIDVCRRSHEMPVDLILEDYDQPDDSPGPVESLQDHQMAAAIHRCLERLPPDHRRMIMAAYYEGLTHEALAHASARPLGTVKTWIRRGLAQLRECLSL